MKAQIVINLNDLFSVRKYGVGPITKGWELLYCDDDGSFWCHSCKGGLRSANAYAKKLKAKLRTDPEIIVAEPWKSKFK